MSPDALPLLPHVASEFYLWLWWSIDQRDAVFELGGKVGTITLWVEERLAFRHPNETKITAVMTGDRPDETLEARAALAGGKVVQDLRLHMRRDDREFTFTLKGAALDLAQAKLPQAVSGGDEALYDRMFLYEEVSLVVGALLREFARERLSPRWDADVVPAIRDWSLASRLDATG